MRRPSILIAPLCALYCLPLPSRTCAHGNVTIMHSFGDGSIMHDGSEPQAPLTQGNDGNFYGTTVDGGYTGIIPYGAGTVYKITPSGAMTIIYTFETNSNKDLYWPRTSLIQGMDVFFYGCAGGNDGIFKVSPSGNEAIVTYSGVLNASIYAYDFTAPLLLADDGNYYVPTHQDLTGDRGTILKITPAGVVTTFHSFSNDTADAPSNPIAGLIQGRDGYLYGTSVSGGKYNWGAIYKISLSGAITVLYSFTPGPDGSGPVNPCASVIQGQDGNLYGDISGTIYKLTPKGTFTILAQFDPSPSDPAGLVQGTDGNIYGTTYSSIFKITPSGVASIEHSFTYTSVPNDGSYPVAGLIQGKDGAFYGTTLEGGSAGEGAVYRVTFTNPTITNLYPAKVNAGSGNFTLKVVGSGFDKNTILYWSVGGVTYQHTAAYVSPTILSATISAAEAQSMGTANVSIGWLRETPTAPLRFTIVDPITLTNLSPSSVQAGHTTFTLTVTGTAFQAGALIYWNGKPLKTTFVSSTRLTALIPTANVASVSMAKVSVANTGSTPTKAIPFPVTAGPNLTRLSQYSIQAGHPSFTLAVAGSEFVNGARIFWNGSPLATTFVASTHLSAPISAANIAKAGTALITVVNPNIAPTQPITFTVTTAQAPTAISN